MADAESADWVRTLTSTGAEYDDAVARLHELLLRAARAEVSRRAPRIRISGPELDDLAYQAAADAMVAVTRKVDQFRGESRFTTWAYKFVILDVSSKIGRHFWRHPAVALDAEDWDRMPAVLGAGPVEESERRELMSALRRAVDESLTDRQRRIFVAVVLNGVSVDTMVVELDTNRNAIYKALFDARRKIRATLEANGYLTNEMSRQS